VDSETSTLVGRLTVASASQRMANYCWKWRGQANEPFKCWWAATISLERLST